MERLNWAVLGLMGIVTALGLTTSSGAGKTKTELTDGDVEVVACAPLTTEFKMELSPTECIFPSQDFIPVELAANVPAATHSHAGCSACAAKKAAANDTAKPEARSKAFDELVAMIQSATGHSVSGDCLGNCQETGVCCDKSLPKSGAAVAAKTETPPCEGECLFGKKQEVVANLDQALPPRSGVLIQTHNPAAETSDCPLTRAADAFANLTKNFVCEGGECLTKQGHGTLTITAVDPAAAKPEGLSNLLAAAAAVKTDQPAETITVDELPANEITVDTGPILTTAEGLKAIEALSKNKPATAATTQPAAKVETKATAAPSAVTQPASDNSRAAARASKLAKLEAKLEAPWKWEFDQVSFDEVVQIVQVNLGVPVMVDRKALEEAAYDTASRFKIEKQPEMESAQYLRLKLGEHGLTWIVPASNDCVLITTLNGMENTRLNRVFDVTDLVNDADFDGDDLVKRIECLVEPTTWRANGGPGELAIWKSEKRLRLMSANNYWVQREVATLLEDLRLNSPQNLDHAAHNTAAEAVAVIRRYDLPTQPDVKDPLDRQKIMQAQQVFLLSVLKDLPQFNPEVFVAAEYNLRAVLVTKQLPEVHQRIKQRLKELEVQRLGSF